MIWSVSTLLCRNGTAVPVWVVNLSMWICPSASRRSGRRRKVGGRAQPAQNRGRSGNLWRHQMGATALALPALKVAVGRRRTALAGRQLVRIHAETHRASGATPLRTGRLEDDVEALGLGLQTYSCRARYDEHPGVGGDRTALDHLCSCPQVLDPAVGARP